MIRKFRTRLIAAAMASLLIVLICIIGIAGILSYHRIVSEADSKLQLLAENNGSFPNNFGMTDPPEAAEEAPVTNTDSAEETLNSEGTSAANTDSGEGNQNPEGTSAANADSGEGNQNPEGTPAADSGSNEENQNPADAGEPEDTDTPADQKLFGKDGKTPHQFSPEMPYEIRYFSVVLTESGTVVSVNTGKIAAVDTETAMSYAQTIFESGATEGFLGDYRYLVSPSTDSDSTIQIIFLDCGRDLGSFRSFLLICLVVMLIGLIAVFVLLLLTSGRITRVFSESYEKQKRFITDAGHELKTPLTIIDADTQVLEMDYGTNEWLQDIQAQTKRLADLTNSLVFLARMEEDQPQVEMIDFPLSDITEETVQSFQARALTENKTLQMKIQPLITLHGDEKSIRRLITIFLDNAMKYSDENGTISVTLEQQKNQIRLTVYNTAESVSRDSLKNLFDRFYRTDKSRNSKTGGYGLGLSIAAAIVRTHKGKIQASTEDEKSLRITVTFPG